MKADELGDVAAGVGFGDVEVAEDVFNGDKACSEEVPKSAGKVEIWPGSGSDLLYSSSALE